MLYSVKYEDIALESFYHILMFFIILYIYYVFYQREKTSEEIDKKVRSVINNKKIYDNMDYSLTQQNRIDVLIRVSKDNFSNLRKKDTKITESFYMYFILLFLGALCTLYLRKYNYKRLKSFLYSNITTFVYLITVKSLFIHNIEEKYDRVNKDEIFNNIKNTLERILPVVQN